MAPPLYLRRDFSHADSKIRLLRREITRDSGAKWSMDSAVLPPSGCAGRDGLPPPSGVSRQCDGGVEAAGFGILQLVRLLRSKPKSWEFTTDDDANKLAVITDEAELLEHIRQMSLRSARTFGESGRG